MVNGDLPSSDIGDQHRNEKWADSFRSTLHENTMGVLEHLDAADTGPNDDSHLIQIGRILKIRLGNGLFCRDHRKEREEGHFLGHLGIVVGIYIQIFDLTSNVNAKFRGVKMSNRTDAVLARKQSSFEGVERVTDGRHYSHTGYDDASHNVGYWIVFIASDCRCTRRRRQQSSAFRLLHPGSPD
jgi:hypothetical protein